MLPAQHSGGGGLFSTVNDYLRFMRMLLREGELDGARVLSRATVAAMTRENQLRRTGHATLSEVHFDPKTGGNAYHKGLAWNLMGRLIEDHGAVPGGEYQSTDGEYGWSGLATTWFSLQKAVPRGRGEGTASVGVLMMSQCTASFEFPHRAQLRWLASKAVKKYLEQQRWGEDGVRASFTPWSN